MIVCLASLMHILWGIVLLVNQGAIHITAASTLYQMTGSAHYDLRALIYLISGVLPAILVLRPHWNLAGLLASAPQQILLLLAGIAAVTAVTSGTYPDGTMRSWLFILMDQGLYILFPILYAFETLDRFKDQAVLRSHEIYLTAEQGAVKILAKVELPVLTPPAPSIVVPPQGITVVPPPAPEGNRKKGLRVP